MKHKNKLLNIILILFGGFCSIGNSQIHEIEIDSLMQKANTFQKTSNWDSARFYYYQSIQLQAKHKNYASIAQAYKNIGNGFIRKGNLDSAMTHLQNSEHIYSTYIPKDLTGIIKVYNSIAVIEAYKNNYKESNYYFEKAFNINQSMETPNKKIGASLSNNIGTNYERLGKYFLAKKYFNEALKIKINEYGENHESLASTYVNIGTIYYYMNQFIEAIDHYLRALSIGNIQTKTSTLIRTYHHLGIAFSSLEDYKKAELYLNKAISVVKKEYGENHFEVANIKIALSKVFLKNNNFNKAIELCLEAISLHKSEYPEMKREIGLAYQKLSYIYESKGDIDAALLYANKSLKIYLSISEKLVSVADLLSVLGRLNALQNNFTEAQAYYLRCLTIRKELFSTQHPTIATTHKNLGELAIKNNRLAEAKKHFINGLNALSNIDFISEKLDYPDIANISSNRVYLELIQSIVTLQEARAKATNIKSEKIALLNKSLSGCQRAQELIFAIQKNMDFDRSKHLLTENSQAIFDKALSIAFELYSLTQDEKYIKHALVFSEQSRSLIFWTNTQSVVASEFGNIPKNIQALEKEIMIHLTYLENQKHLGFDTNELQDEYFATTQKQDSLITSIEKNYPKYYKLKYKQRNINVKKIMESLSPSVALVEYFVGEEFLYIFTIKRDSVLMHRTKIDKIPSMINELVAGLKKMDFFSFDVPSGYLYSKLIEPIEKEIISVQNLVIVPSGVLCFLPFEVLASSTSTESFPDFTKLNYLIQDYNISYNLSANQFSKNKNINYDQTFIAFAPINSFAKLTNNTNTIFSELPNSDDEIINIGQTLFADNYLIKNYINNDATELNLKSLPQNQYQFLHIATHGVMNTIVPELSALYFFDSHGNEDNILYASEIYNLNIPADLVVLSSCESGVGKLVKGEGLLSLSRSFLYAGANNIMFSLWKVTDFAAYTLMNNFYAQIVGGNNYSDALRKAKLEMISNAETAYPRNWSGFVLIESNK